MRAAIYARRSTEEHQAASLDVQVSEARRWIEARGWSVDAAHVYTDSGVSGAEFKRRPALIAMLNAAEARAFDCVVTRDESRLGRDTNRVGIVIQDLVDAGIQLWYYFAGERVEANDAMSKFLIAVRSFASELEREKLAGRTREHLRHKAARGLVVGGKVYGYDNIEHRDGERRTHVEYKINAREAAIVREVFERFAAGEGLRTIVHALNARGIAPPRQGSGASAGVWCVNTIKPMLERERYRGTLVWGQVAKGYRGGTKVRAPRPEEEWVTVQREDLRIVPESLWASVEARRQLNTALYTKHNGLMARAEYLLSSLARCGVCGGPISVSGSRTNTTPIRVYACSWHRNRGDAVCTVKTRRPVEAVDAAVVGWIRAHVLTPDVVDVTVDRVRQLWAAQQDGGGADRPALESEAASLAREIDRLTRALALSDEAPDALVLAVRDREAKLRAVRAKLAAIAVPMGGLAEELERAATEARRRVDDLAGVLGRGPKEGRRVIEALLKGRMRFVPVLGPEGKPRYRIEAELVVGNLFTTESVPSGSLTAVNTANSLRAALAEVNLCMQLVA